MNERLQKFLAEAGLGSRRSCEDLIRSGRVSIDGRTAELGVSVDADTQAVAVDGRPVKKESKEYWLLNKPAGVLSAALDPRGRPTVVDCIPARVRVFPVGRLDLHSTGLLLLTNDGELAARLLHPRYHVEKEYVVTVRGLVTEAALGRLRRGVMLEDGQTQPAIVEVVKSGRSTTGGFVQHRPGDDSRGAQAAGPPDAGSRWPPCGGAAPELDSTVLPTPGWRRDRHVRLPRTRLSGCVGPRPSCKASRPERLGVG